MAINRENIHELVEVFYQHPFKTFYVNSLDGVNFIKPVGVFVSLGITTSIKVLEKIKDDLINNGYSACLTEITSRKVNDRFLNTLNCTTGANQYKLSVFDENMLDEQAAKKKLSDMKELMDPEQSLEILKKYAPKISKLESLINKLSDSNGWNDHLIQEDEDDFRIFHRNINYKREGDIEYRLGIYVHEKNDN